MRARLVVPLLVTCVGAFGCATASAVTPPAGPVAASPPPLRTAAVLTKGAPPVAAASGARPSSQADKARPVYRLDFVLEDGASGAGTTGGSYTMNLEEDRVGALSVGSNVPLSPSNARHDVGLRISASYARTGDDLLLHSSLELSSTEDKGAVHKVTTQGDAVIAPGKRALVASLDDPRGHMRYQLFATATKLR